MGSREFGKALRVLFNHSRIPFDMQADIIAQVAKKKMGFIGHLLAHSPLNGKVAALDLWKSVTLISENWFDNDVAKKMINHNYPLLKGQSKQIADELGYIYKFWTDNVYACTISGEKYNPTVCFSKIRDWGVSHFQIINSKSGMPGLGERIKNYAEYVYLTFEEEKT